MLEWIRKLFGRKQLHRWGPYPPTGANEDGSLPVSKVVDDQREFKTYAEAMSWVFQTGEVAMFEWDDKRQVYVRR